MDEGLKLGSSFDLCFAMLQYIQRKRLFVEVTNMVWKERKERDQNIENGKFKHTVTGIMSDAYVVYIYTEFVHVCMHKERERGRGKGEGMRERP